MRRYWSERTASNRRRAYPKFKGTDTADVVVIGGGLTGCLTTHVLASAGLDVVLLEADRLAEGSTAGSLGAIVPEPDATFRSVEPIVGRRVARTIWAEARRGASELAAALEKLPTRSDLESTSFFINARTPEAAAELRREQAARRVAGLEAGWAPAATVRTEIGGESVGALRARSGAVYDPVRAALGFAGAAGARGARIFERSAVRRTRFTRKDATVHLTSGAIRTRGIVVATGEPGALFGQLRRHVRRREGHVVVTEPVSAAMRREMGRRAGIVTETGEAAHWLRWLPDDRVLFAGALAAPAAPQQAEKTLVQRAGQLMYELSVCYPAISGLPAAWSWSLPVVSTPDTLPWIGPHRNYPFHFFALGFGWHGDALAWVAARAALRHFRNETRREDEVLGFVRHL